MCFIKRRIGKFLEEVFRAIKVIYASKIWIAYVIISILFTLNVASTYALTTDEDTKVFSHQVDYLKGEIIPKEELLSQRWKIDESQEEEVLAELKARHEEKMARIAKLEAEQKKRVKEIAEIQSSVHYSMNIAKPSGFTKKEFVDLINKNLKDPRGIFKENAEFIWDMAQKYQVNEIAFCAIVAQESGYCTSKQSIATNNYTSQMNSSGKLRKFKSAKECFKVTMKNLGNNYLKKDGKYYNGITLKAVNKFYCEPVSDINGNITEYGWSECIYSIMCDIYG